MNTFRVCFFTELIPDFSEMMFVKSLEDYKIWINHDNKNILGNWASPVCNSKYLVQGVWLNSVKLEGAESYEECLVLWIRTKLLFKAYSKVTATPALWGQRPVNPTAPTTDQLALLLRRGVALSVLEYLPHDTYPTPRLCWSSLHTWPHLFLQIPSFCKGGNYYPNFSQVRRWEH